MQPQLPGHLAHNVALAHKTTLGVGGAAQAYLSASGPEQLLEALVYARAQGLPVCLLGHGSNVVVADAGVSGLVLQQSQDRIVFRQDLQRPQIWHVYADAGASWQQLAWEACTRGLAGLECLVGIPGSAGAAPVQNIGAYGQELSDVLQAVDVICLQTLQIQRLRAAQLQLRYRHSLLRQHPDRWVVTGIHLQLRQGDAAEPRYESLRAAIAALENDGPLQPIQLAQAVLEQRRARGMLWDAQTRGPGNVGSFFMNPTVTAAQAQHLRAEHPHMPQHPQADTGSVKLAAAWLIEQSGMPRGFVFAGSNGRVALSAKHTLALVNLGDASAADVLSAARFVQQQVLQRFGVPLLPEARWLGFSAATWLHGLPQ